MKNKRYSYNNNFNMLQMALRYLTARVIGDHAIKDHAFLFWGGRNRAIATVKLYVGYITDRFDTALLERAMDYNEQFIGSKQKPGQPGLFKFNRLKWW